MANGPVTGGIYQYPEYIQESWNYPEGDLVIDQRHRTRLWINYGVPKADGLTLSLLQALESGIPYAAGGIPIQGGNSNGVNSSAVRRQSWLPDGTARLDHRVLLLGPRRLPDRRPEADRLRR